MYTKDRDSAGTDEKVMNWRIRRVLLYLETNFPAEIKTLHFTVWKWWYQTIIRI